MWRYILLATCITVYTGLFTAANAQSPGPQDLFLTAYTAFQEGEKLEQNGSFKLALAKFRYTASLLDQIKERSPDWQPLIIGYRTRKTKESIQRLEEKVSLLGGTESTEVPSVEPELPESGGLPSIPSPVRSTGRGTDFLDQATNEIRGRIEQLENELQQSRRQLRVAQQEKAELANQVEQLRSEADRSRIREAEATAKLTQAQEALQNSLADDSNNEQQRKTLQAQVEQLRNELEDVRAERDIADEASSGLASQVTVLKQERDTAVAQAATAKESQAKVEQLLAANNDLTQKLEIAETTIQQFNADLPKKDEEITNLRKEIDTVKEQLAAAQKESSDFQNTMMELQAQLAQAKTESEEIKSSGASPEEKKQLTHENELLRGIVMRQLKEQARREQSRKLILGELSKLEVQSNTLMEQIDFLSQPVTQLTEEERTLFKQPVMEISDQNSARAEISIATTGKSAPSPTPKPEEPSPSPTPETAATEPAAETGATEVSPTPTAENSTEPNQTEPELPKAETPAPETDGPRLPKPAEPDVNSVGPVVETESKPNVPADQLPLAREAREYFQQGDYREAEKVYMKILSQAPDNIYALSNLGVVRFRSGKLKLAEESFKKALAIDSDDAFSHSTLGIVYYQQGKYDDAINSLTKALAINSKNATAHNYLGITASQKGWQEAARKEIETAIAIDPNYADAHFNLAVLYITAKPPLKELARKHYKRATELGATADPSLEDLLK